MDPWIELDEDALRQYIDAKTVFEAWESARAKAAEVRGGMLWRTTKGREYLIRTGVDNKQKSLDFKRWMASTAERDPLKVSRDRLQASIVEELANRFRLGV
ncbi:hypothetical protein [Cupriavidus sp. H39]|uniref:hypothetical protein n=1 Tax=Cupriavidus sp. H39 TaxID=3401635 RepID=UPI003CFF68D6